MASWGASDVRMTTPSSPTEMRWKVGGVRHLYCSLGRTVQDEHTTALDVVRLETLQFGDLDDQHFPSDG
jgi:hypothetical protein